MRIALPRQQWLRERVLVLDYKYIVCLVLFKVLNFPQLYRKLPL